MNPFLLMILGSIILVYVTSKLDQRRAKAKWKVFVSNDPFSPKGVFVRRYRVPTTWASYHIQTEHRIIPSSFTTYHTIYSWPSKVYVVTATVTKITKANKQMMTSVLKVFEGRTKANCYITDLRLMYPHLAHVRLEVLEVLVED